MKEDSGVSFNIELFPMREEHVSAVAALEKLCFSEPWSENSLKEEVDNREAIFLVCFFQGQFAGYAGMHSPFGECYIDNIAVCPSYRGKGIGRRLLCALLHQASEKQADFISLEVRPSNRAALGLYHSCGFVQEGIRKGFYRQPPEDGLILTKRFR